MRVRRRTSPDGGVRRRTPSLSARQPLRQPPGPEADDQMA